MEEQNQDGLCMCGCGKPAPIAAKTARKYGHVKGKPTRYLRGHHRRGLEHTEESRQVMKQKSRQYWDALSAEDRKMGPMPDWWKQKISDGQQKMESHWNWKGGRSIYGHGYIGIRVPGHPMANAQGVVAEHRLIMSEHLGRLLLPTEDVHHINGDKQDNRIENLAVLDHGDHSFIQHGRIYEAAIGSLVAQGRTADEIAEYFHLTVDTVKNYMEAIE